MRNKGQTTVEYVLIIVVIVVVISVFAKPVAQRLPGVIKDIGAIINGFSSAGKVTRELN
jgi:Sec-independent protein translocase protein TatA